ncbi:MAG: DJ-1/PfpI family protein [Spirochaetaceae bacterium]|nr:DJ-1/PfpI family protein [Spirochaetaceae bacterium]
MKAFVFFAEGFEEVEALTPVDYLRRAGVEVLMISCGSNLQVTGSHRIKVVAETLAKDVAEKLVAGTLELPDMVVVPGGMPGAANVAECVDATQLIKAVYDAGGITAAICAAPVVVFAKLGLLTGKNYTCYPGMEQQMEKWAGSKWQNLTAKSKYTGKRCVQDGNLVTAAGPGVAEEFTLALVKLLVGKEVATNLAINAVMR